jgi:hypothetical protein
VSKRSDDDVQFPGLLLERISFARMGESASRGYSFRRRKARTASCDCVTVSGGAVGEEADEELSKMSESRNKGG